VLPTPDEQISLTDPGVRSMATSGRGSGIVGYNVQMAVDTKQQLMIMHEVTNVGNDRSKLARKKRRRLWKWTLWTSLLIDTTSASSRFWPARRRASRSRFEADDLER
jgi:hypothetical protein